MGGGDSDGNPSLYDAIYKAKKASMPADNIKRAVKRGSGEEAGGANYEDIVYEGYAPAGVGLIIECLTDNRNRAAADVRSTLTKGNGSLATTGSVGFDFERKGQIVVPAEGVDFDNLFEKAAEAGAEAVTDDGEVFTVITDPSDMIDVRKALQDAGFDCDSADLVMMPKNEVELSLEDARRLKPAHTAGFLLSTWMWCVPMKASQDSCLLAIYNGLVEKIERFAPDAVSIERVFAQENRNTVPGTAQAAGLAMLAAAQRGIPVALHTPTESKLAITGNGKAEKSRWNVWWRGYWA